jgi:glucose-6-phosphate 1-dehydrogenase
MIDRIVIFGGGGDLTGRYLAPALAELHRAGQLPQPVRVIGVGRHEWSDERFREHCTARIGQDGRPLPAGQLDQFRRRLSWRHADATDPADLRGLLDESPRPPVLYLALPPAVYAPFLDALPDAGLPSGTRVVVEKPFGTGQDSARDLNRRLRRLLPEEHVFRVDHFLGKQTVQNLIGLRFANRLFEPLWSNVHIAQVEIIWEETLALEGRAGYYDHTGALRDMLQNHLLQLLALVAMEPPAGLSERDLRDRKVDVLRATGLRTPREPARASRRARYTAGTVAGRRLPDYAAEEGVDPRRQTETLAEAVFTVDNWRWAGVPFVLRTAKAMAADRTEVALRFRPVPHPAFPTEHPRCNVLRLHIDPDRIHLDLNVNRGGDPLTLAPAELSCLLAPQELPAYARLLRDILDGDPMLSIRGDEAEEAWRIVEPILDAWRGGAVPLQTYPAGSTGPAAT